MTPDPISLRIVVLLISYFLQMQILFDFEPDANVRSWMVVNDGVMGGRSRGDLKINPEGHGHFQGTISLENYGGFSSIRYGFNSVALDGQRNVRLRVRGDGKRYQFRVKADRSEYYSYISYFQTSGEWEDITLPLEAFYPAFRGRTLQLPNFDRDQLQEISILIGNKRAENFSLEIDRIWLE